MNNGIQPTVELATNNGNGYPYPVYPMMGGTGFGGTIGEVAGMFPNSTLIIAANNHLVCSKCGVLLDTFDPRYKRAEYVWLVK